MFVSGGRIFEQLLSSVVLLNLLWQAGKKATPGVCFCAIITVVLAALATALTSLAYRDKAGEVHF